MALGLSPIDSADVLILIGVIGDLINYLAAGIAARWNIFQEIERLGAKSGYWYLLVWKWLVVRGIDDLVGYRAAPAEITLQFPSGWNKRSCGRRRGMDDGPLVAPKEKQPIAQDGSPEPCPRIDFVSVDPHCAQSRE